MPMLWRSRGSRGASKVAEAPLNGPARIRSSPTSRRGESGFLSVGLVVEAGQGAWCGSTLEASAGAESSPECPDPMPQPDAAESRAIAADTSRALRRGRPRPRGDQHAALAWRCLQLGLGNVGKRLSGTSLPANPRALVFP